MKLTEIWIYPVKSLPGIRLESAAINARGFEYDRNWMLVDDEGQFMSQRRSVRMAMINVAMVNDELQFEYEGKESLRIPLKQNSDETMMVTVWKDTLEASLVSDKADRWFSDVLDMSVQLVCMKDTVTRNLDPGYASEADQTGFSDGFPFLLLSQASIDDLNYRINDADHVMEVRRFRPNLLVSGCEPYAEDDWLRVRIGTIDFRVVKPCSRCVITTINPDTTNKSVEPLRTLNTYRKKGRLVYFGQNLIHDAVGSVCVGDQLELVE
ncbi:MAG: MOSC domain-containing protein [Gammaproteobacteria bacterium]|nr:MOSC domain-containing protein [Gammaproteobacteria bacterium]NNJ90710.1 MOSC domain-containing protein [Gammaproteobacteria bacterium]